MERTRPQHPRPATRRQPRPLRPAVGVIVTLVALALAAPEGDAQLGLTGRAQVRGGGQPGGPRILLPTRKSTGTTSRVRTLHANGTEVGRYDVATGNEYFLDDVDVVRARGKALLLTYDALGATGHFTVLRASDCALVVRHDFAGGEHPVLGVDPVATPDARYAAVLTQEVVGGRVRLYDLDADVLVDSYPLPGNEVPLEQLDPVFTPLGDKLLVPTYDSGGATGHLRIFDVPALTLHGVVDLDLAEHPVQGVDVLVTPDGATAVLATYDALGASGAVHFVDIPSATIRDTYDLMGNEHPVDDVDPVLSPDAARVALPVYQGNGASGRVVVLDVASGTLDWDHPFQLNEYPLEAVDAVFSPDGSRLVVPTYESLLARGRLHILDTVTGAELFEHVFDANEYPIVELDPVFTPDGSRLLLPTYDAVGATSHLRVFSMPGGTAMVKVPMAANEYPVEGVDVVVSGDSRKAYLATYQAVGATGRVRILDVASATFTAEVPFDANEYPVEGCDLVVAGNRVLVPTYRAFGATGRLRILSVVSDAVIGQFDYDANEFPMPGVDVLSLAGPAPDPDEDFHDTGAVPPVPPPPPPPPPPII